MNLLDLSGQRIVVTGASSGIGRVTATVLSQLGATLVLVGRNEERLAETAGGLAGSGHLIEPFDLNDLDAIGGWMKSVVKRGAEPLSGLVHSAGIGITRPLQIMQAQHYESVLRINLLAAAMLAKGYRQKGVNRDGGAIVFISSVAGLKGWSGFSAYAASKAGLHGLTRSLAVELAGQQIRVNAIASGAVRTPMLDEAEATGDQRSREIHDMHPLGIGEPIDVAHAVAFLLAKTGRWITGAVLPVDGGCSAR